MGLGTGPSFSKPKLQAIVRGDDIAIVTILESRILDEANIHAIGKELTDLVTKRYMIKMIVDLTEVQYLSSAVLRVFIALYKQIKAENGDLKLCCVRPSIREVFKVTQLDKMIPILETQEAAVNDFKKKSWGFLKR